MNMKITVIFPKLTEKSTSIKKLYQSGNTARNSNTYTHTFASADKYADDSAHCAAASFENKNLNRY